MPRKIAKQSSSWNIAARCAFLPKHSACRPPCGREHNPPLPKHLRLSAANLLDASKDEFFNKFDNLDDQIDRDFDEYEVEGEQAGPSYQMVLRWAF